MGSERESCESPRTTKTVSTYLTTETQRDNEQIYSARTKDSYKVRFFDGKAPGTADDGKINKEPHVHNQNWGRTGFLLIEGGTIILRLLLEEKIKQSSNGNLPEYLKIPSNYQTLFDLYQGKVISPLQWNVLYPKTNANLVSLLELDVILLHLLIIYTCQFRGDILMDIQKLEKRRDCLYEYEKDAKIPDSKFEQEYEAVGAVLLELIVSRGLGRDVDSRVKNMVKSLKTLNMTREEIVIYMDTIRRWYLSDIDVRKAVKELKPLLKNGQGEHRKAKDILAKLKMVAEDDSNKTEEMKDIKEELEKLALDLGGIKKKKTKIKTVHNILSILTPRFSHPFSIEAVGGSIPSVERWTHDGVQFVLSFYCQGQLHVYTKSTKLVVEAKIKVLAGDERLPQAEVATVKALDSAKFREQLVNDLHLNEVGTINFKERSFWIVPVETTEQGYRKLIDIVKVPIWKSAISNVFETEEVKGHLRKGGCPCISGDGDPVVMVDIRCRGSDIVLNSPSGNIKRPSPFSWRSGSRSFVAKKYFLGKAGGESTSIQCVVVDLTIKRSKKIDAAMETKLGQQLNDEKLDLSSLLEFRDGISSVKCDVGKSSITIAFSSLAAVKLFHDKFRYCDIRTFVDKIFDLPKVQKVMGNIAYDVYIDVTFSVPEVECKGQPEPAAPTVPRSFKIIEVTTTSVVLSWERPLNDGGNEIISYHVEKNDTSEKKWVKVGVIDPSETKCHVTNLQTSHEYYFRIKAENLAGSSSFVETAEPALLSRTKAAKTSEVLINVKDDKTILTSGPVSKQVTLVVSKDETHIKENGDMFSRQNSTEATKKQTKAEPPKFKKEKTFVLRSEVDSKINKKAKEKEDGDVRNKTPASETKRDNSFRKDVLARSNTRFRELSLKSTTDVQKKSTKKPDRLQQRFTKTSDSDVTISETVAEPESAVNYYSSDNEQKLVPDREHSGRSENTVSQTLNTHTEHVAEKKKKKKTKTKKTKIVRKMRPKTPVFM